MNKSIVSVLTFAAVITSAFFVACESPRQTSAPRPMAYKAVPDWYKLPEGREKIGNMHGDVAVSSKGEVYVSVMDPKAGLQVYAADGKFLRNVPNAPDDFHGFVIKKEKDGEFIYGPRLNAGSIIKMKLDGTVVMTIPSSDIPDEFKNKNKEGKGIVRLTGMDLLPNGDLYVTDGYSSDYVHQFTHSGKYLKSFGGKKAPYGFKTLHKIAIDTRFTPPRIIGTDRANMRVVHLSMDGEFLGVVATDLLLPAAVAIRGDYAAIGELKGQVTILDKEGKVVARFGTNTTPGEAGSNKPEPAVWHTGIVTAPHGVAFNGHGDLFVSEYNLTGRIHRFNLE
jgi:hypothetical protein